MHSDLHIFPQCYLFYTYTSFIAQLKKKSLEKQSKQHNNNKKNTSWHFFFLFKSINNKKKVPGDVEDTWGLAIYFEVNKE